MTSTTTLICPACQHEAAGKAPLREAVYRCDACGARIAYGVLMPRVSLSPSADGRWFTLRFEREGQVAEHTLDEGLLEQLVGNALSVVQLRQAPATIPAAPAPPPETVEAEPAEAEPAEAEPAEAEPSAPEPSA